MRGFTSSLLACTVALVMLVLSLSLRSEPLRAVAVFIAAGLLYHGWGCLRPRLQSRFGLVGLSVTFSTGALACAWSGLNVARFYLYNPANGGHCNLLHLLRNSLHHAGGDPVVLGNLGSRTPRCRSHLSLLDTFPICPQEGVIRPQNPLESRSIAILSRTFHSEYPCDPIPTLSANRGWL
jgi:hypothetical protein